MVIEVKDSWVNFMLVMIYETSKLDTIAVVTVRLYLHLTDPLCRYSHSGPDAVESHP